MLRSTSYSRLLDYEGCPYKVKLKLIDKIPEPERPLPPGKTEHANERGTRVHDECEKFVNGTSETMPVEAEKYFRDEMLSLRKHYKKGRASLEEEWAFDKQWQSVDWLIGWLRMKADAVVFLTPEHAVVIDYKTGRLFGNEIKHGEQLQLYALAVLLRYPQVQHVTSELWYFDVNDLMRLDITRTIGMRSLKPFDKRFNKMTNATEFPPTPNKFACMWCPYHPAKGSGDCPHGV